MRDLTIVEWPVLRIRSLALQRPPHSRVGDCDLPGETRQWGSVTRNARVGTCFIAANMTCRSTGAAR